MVDIWKEQGPVKFGEVDRSGRLTLAAAFELFQEVAINHAENLGVGRDALLATRQGWVLSRMSVIMERRPKWGETVTVRSWPRGADRLFAVRDYDIRDGEDKPVVRGRSGWLILDIDKRRPLRVQPLVENLPPNTGLDALSGSPLGLETHENLAKAVERKAAYSDIDYNGHVNNARYIPWIQDTIDAEILEQADRIRFDINYLNEIKYGELIEFWTGLLPESPAGGSNTADAAADGNGAYSQTRAFEGRRSADGQAMFRVELRTGR